MKKVLTTRRAGAAAAALALTGAFVTMQGGVTNALTSINPYAESLTDDYELTPLISSADKVPHTGHPGESYRMVGIPDGLGAHVSGFDRVTVYMNHEFGSNTTLSEPVVGGPKNKGAIVSKWTLDRKGNVLSGKRAYDTVYIDDTLIGPAATNEAGNTTRGFARFCSGSLAGPEQGFDRYIYFANEESNAGLDPKGGLSVAIFDNDGKGEAHGLSYLGRFAWENTLVQSNTGRWTVIMGMEDGNASTVKENDNSQVYMYVGYKSRKKDATVLERNGLVGGKLYVFRSTDDDPKKNSEALDGFQEGTIKGEWVEIPNPQDLSAAQLETASDLADGMRFVRPEDGAFNPRNSNEYFFVTTGDSGGNVLGRLYSLRLNWLYSWGPARLEVLYNADKVIAAGGDIAISPDNIDVSSKYLMINEDGTTPSRAKMGALGRDGSIWRFKLNPWQGLDVDSAERVVELSPPGRDGAAVGPGVWETSGIIDSSELFGAYLFGWFKLFESESWLFDVQAHSPTAAPDGSTVTVEDGQLLLMTRNHSKHEFPGFPHLPWFRWWARW